MPSLAWYLLGLFTPALLLGAVVLVAWLVGWHRVADVCDPPRLVEYAPGAYKLNPEYVRALQHERDAEAVEELLKSL